MIKGCLESSFPAILVEGEVSNFTDHSSGHIYFTLKDEKSQIKCTLWKWQRGVLKFALEEGMKVIIGGPVKVYERGGNTRSMSVLSTHPVSARCSCVLSSSRKSFPKRAFSMRNANGPFLNFHHESAW